MKNIFASNIIKIVYTIIFSTLFIASALAIALILINSAGVKGVILFIAIMFLLIPDSRSK